MYAVIEELRRNSGGKILRDLGGLLTDDLVMTDPSLVLFFCIYIRIPAVLPNDFHQDWRKKAPILIVLTLCFGKRIT